MRRKITAFLLAGIVTAAITGNIYAGENETAQAESETAVREESKTEDEKTPLLIGSDRFSGKFSPFFADTTADQLISELTQVSLFGSDRDGVLLMNGIKGEDREYEGTSYHYDGISDVAVERKGDTTVCTIQLRDGVMFSDGTAVTADDLIFTYYVYCDTDYDGSAALYGSDIQGLEAYRMNNSVLSEISAQDIQNVLHEMPDELQVIIHDVVMAELLQDEYDWAQDVWRDYSKDYGIESGDEFFAMCYSTDDAYDVRGKDEQTILREIAAMYGNDYHALSAAYGDENYLNGKVSQAARDYLVQRTADDTKNQVDEISGIRKLSSRTVQITMNGYDASQIAKLGVCVVPMHYYGDPDLYDYENHQFGFTRGDLSAIREKNAVPMGAGPYCFDSYEDGMVRMHANERYWKGKPKVDELICVETDEKSRRDAFEDGSLDLITSASPKDALSMEEENVRVVMTDNLGYGYIGMNAQNVCVGDDPGSAQSRALRKALAVLMAACREEAVKEYYGDSAQVIDYPVCSASGVAPEKGEKGYETAYNRNIKGETIISESMTQEQKMEAAKKAALEYFAYAGYRIQNGRLTQAPQGASLQYTAIVPAYGKGAHPCYKLLREVSDVLDEMGFTLQILDISDSNMLWDARDNAQAQIWAAAWVQTSDPDLYQMYHSESVGSNYYHISDMQLDENILQARSKTDRNERKKAYKKCFDTILDWAVEIPVYQRQNGIIYNCSRIDETSFTGDVTEYYGWYKEIEKISMR